MDIIGIVKLLIQVALIFSMLYFVRVADNFKHLYIDCQQRQLCIEGILKGKVCEKYEATKYNISGAIGNISQP